MPIKGSGRKCSSCLFLLIQIREALKTANYFASIHAEADGGNGEYDGAGTGAQCLDVDHYMCVGHGLQLWGVGKSFGFGLGFGR